MKRLPQRCAVPDRPARLEPEAQPPREQLALERDERELLERATLEARRELELSRERYADLYDTAPTCFVSLDRRGFIREANLTAAKILGVVRPRLPGMLLMHFVAKADRRKFLQHLWRCRQRSAAEVVTELTLAVRNRPALSVQLISLPDHAPARPAAQQRIRTAVVDITTCRQAEEALQRINATLELRVAERTTALRESEERFHIIATSTPDHLLVQDAALRYTMVVNPQLGLSEQDMIGKTDFDFLEKAEAERLTAIKRGVLKTRKSFHVEESLTSKSGKLEYFSGAYVPRFDAQGRPNGLIGYFQNVTDRKRAELALRESEARFRALVQASSDVVYRMSPDWTEMRHLVGRDFIADTAEPSRTWLQEYIPPDDQKQVMAVINKAIRTKSAFELEHRVVRMDGGVGWMFSRAVPMLDADGKLTEWFGMASDITKRKLTEERIFKLSRVRAILTGINRAIAHFPDQQQLLDESCRVAVDDGGFKLAWIGWVTPDSIVQPVATAGETAYLKNIRIVTHDVPEGRGPTGMAIRENRPIISEDVERHQHFSPWLKRALKFGLRFAAAFPLRLGDKVVGSFQVYASRPGFFEEAEMSLLGQVSDDISFALTALEEAAKRRKAEASLQQSNRTLQTIRDCHEAILHAKTEPALLQEICRIIVRTGGERMAWVGYAENDEYKKVRVVAAAGGKSYLPSIRITWADKPRGRGPVGTAIRIGTACICQNTQADPNFAPWRKAARRHGFGSVFALPLIMDGRCQGALCIYSRETEAFDAAEQLLLTDLASDLAFGVLTLRLRAERTRLEEEILKSIEREQERIGRDLHDGLGQMLTGLKFRCGYLQGISAQRLAEVKNEARKMEAILNKAIMQTRGMAHELNPLNVTGKGLVQGLRSLCAEVSTTGRARCVCKVAGRIKIWDHELAGHLYRIAQEALQNALKHARAKNITVSLKRRGGNIVLSIEDDGVGMPLRTSDSSMGMSNMRMRNGLIGGRLEITRRNNGGTSVACEFTPRNRTIAIHNTIGTY